VPPAGGAVVVADLTAQGDQVAIARRGQLQADLRGGSRLAEQELLTAGQLQPQRPSDGPGEESDQRLQLDDLATEAAANRHRDHPDPVRLAVERVGDGVAHDAHRLGRGPDGDRAVALHGDRHHVGLQEPVVDARQCEGPLHPRRRRGKTLVEVAALELDLGADVSDGLLGGLGLGTGSAVDGGLL
jgi:hypothetical protein